MEFVECGCMSTSRYAVYGWKNISMAVWGCWEVVLANDDVISQNPRWRLKTGSSDFRASNDANQFWPLVGWCRKNFVMISLTVFVLDHFKLWIHLLVGPIATNLLMGRVGCHVRHVDVCSAVTTVRYWN